MSSKLKAYLALHFCVLIWGFTAVLGKKISIDALPLVWWRVLLCSVALVFLVKRSSWRKVNRAQVLRMLGIGLIIGAHWACFYGAVKWSNASVAVATMAPTAFFAALTEPIILRQRMQWMELGLGILILPGIWLIVGGIDVDMRAGFALGILGALLAAVFSSLNKREISTAPIPPMLMSFVELSGALLITSVALLVTQTPWTTIQLRGDDWIWMGVLAYGCTLLPFTLSLRAMQHISAFATNLTINLEPVYGVALAILFFREDKMLSNGFYLGVLLILVAVFSHPFLKMRKGDTVQV